MRWHRFAPHLSQDASPHLSRFFEKKLGKKLPLEEFLL